MQKQVSKTGCALKVGGAYSCQSQTLASYKGLLVCGSGWTALSYCSSLLYYVFIKSLGLNGLMCKCINSSLCPFFSCFLQLKMRTITRAGLTCTFPRMWVLTCAQQTYLRNVTCPKNSSTSGPDTQR